MAEKPIHHRERDDSDAVCVYIQDWERILGCYQSQQPINVAYAPTSDIPPRTNSTIRTMHVPLDIINLNG